VFVAAITLCFKEEGTMQISETIHALTIPFTVPTPAGPVARSVTVYLLCGAEVTLLDSGVAGSETIILAYLQEIGRGGDLARLLLTHSHPDHIGAARALQAATGCAVCAPALERAWVEDVERQARERPVPGFATLVGGPVRVDRVVSAGEILELGGGLQLEALAAPGHSSGSTAYFLRAQGALFTGDALPLPHDLPIYDDYRTSLATLTRLAALDGVERLLEAWCAPDATAPAGRFAAAAAWLQEVDAAVQHAAAGDPADAMELCRRVVAQLGLPAPAANPLVARSLASHRALPVCIGDEKR
jgi:glyoxylase-like metal-dependent hydrolase (beta-lactamase superfamily II)